MATADDTEVVHREVDTTIRRPDHSTLATFLNWATPLNIGGVILGLLALLNGLAYLFQPEDGWKWEEIQPYALTGTAILFLVIVGVWLFRSKPPEVRLNKQDLKAGLYFPTALLVVIYAYQTTPISTFKEDVRIFMLMVMLAAVFGIWHLMQRGAHVWTVRAVFVVASIIVVRALYELVGDNVITQSLEDSFFELVGAAGLAVSNLFSKTSSIIEGKQPSLEVSDPHINWIAVGAWVVIVYFVIMAFLFTRQLMSSTYTVTTEKEGGEKTTEVSDRRWSARGSLVRGVLLVLAIWYLVSGGDWEWTKTKIEQSVDWLQELRNEQAAKYKELRRAAPLASPPVSSPVKTKKEAVVTLPTPRPASPSIHKIVIDQWSDHEVTMGTRDGIQVLQNVVKGADGGNYAACYQVDLPFDLSPTLMNACSVPLNPREDRLYLSPAARDRLEEQGLHTLKVGIEYVQLNDACVYNPPPPCPS